MTLKHNKLKPVLYLSILLTTALFLSACNIGKDTSEMAVNSEYEIYNSNIKSVLPKDQIPPLENPEYVSVDTASGFLYDEDMVFVLESNDEVFVYPQRIMVWHEVVNEEIDGKNVSVTYCPLTGSAIGYLGNDGVHIDNTYGTSGSLVNSNLILYDRESESYIPQILGTGINGTLEGIELETVPVFWAKWEDVKATYPQANVLTINTGFQRDYFADPYGSYLSSVSQGNYYAYEGTIYDPLNENDGTFHDKKVVIGIKGLEDRLAVDPELVRANGFIEFEVDNVSGIAIHDTQLDIIRVFNRNLSNQILSFSAEDQTLLDNRGIIWTSRGLSENGESLNSITYFEVMWFAWHGYYPDTNVMR